MRRRISIRTRLSLIASAAVAATALLVCVLAWLILYQTLIYQVDQELQDLAHGPLSQMDPGQVLMIQNMSFPEPTGVQIQVLLPNGRTITTPPDAAPTPLSAADRTVTTGRTLTIRYTLDTGQGRYRVQTFRTSNGLVVRLLRTLANQDAALRRVGFLMIALTLGSTVAAAAAGRLVATTGLRPIDHVTRAATRIADTRDLQQPMPVTGDDEVAQLSRSFNRMLVALGRSQQAQKELIEDAAHELRTPMASMRTNVELLIHAGGRLTPADSDALLGDLDRQSMELSDLVADLVALARSAGADEPSETVDLAQVVAEAIQRATVRTPHARFAVDSRPVTARVQPTAIERAVVNLLDNAVKFGPADQTVDIRVTSTQVGTVRFAEIAIADRGPGIPASERERIFRRFHRLDTARAVPGSGLGLAIVHQTITTHDGSVTVEPRPGGGNIFRLRIPDATEPAAEPRRGRSPRR